MQQACCEATPPDAKKDEDKVDVCAPINLKKVEVSGRYKDYTLKCPEVKKVT